MGKIILPVDAKALSQTLTDQNKRIVLTGGCFDLLHRGHIDLLSNAKKQGDVLFVMLESDQTITHLKGQTRPINTQDDRAYLLSHIEDVDYIIMLPPLLSNEDYDKLIFDIKPAIIATTKGDPAKMHKIRQAETVSAKVIDVTDVVTNASTTRLADILSKEI